MELVSRPTTFNLSDAPGTLGISLCACSFIPLFKFPQAKFYSEDPTLMASIEVDATVTSDRDSSQSDVEDTGIGLLDLLDLRCLGLSWFGRAFDTEKFL